MSNPFVNRLLATDNGAGALALRIPAGIIFGAHRAPQDLGTATTPDRCARLGHGIDDCVGGSILQRLGPVNEGHAP